MAQIGTVRLETQNSGVVDVPVFEPGDSASGIYEFVRVETASGPGFIPVTDPVDATYPYLRVQSQNNGIVAVTDTPGSAIPDSAIHRWGFGEGSGSTTADLIGSADMSLNGVSFASGNWVNGFAGEGDGIDDVGNVGQLGTFGSSLDTDFAIAFTIETTVSDSRPAGTRATDANQLLWIYIGDAGWNPSGRIAFRLRNTSGNDVVQSYTNSRIDDGNTYRIVINKTGNTGSGVEFWINGSEDGTNVEGGGATASFDDFDRDFLWFAQNDDGEAGIRDYSDSLLDDIIIFDQSLSSSEIQDDYNRQPWS